MFAYAVTQDGEYPMIFIGEDIEKTMIEAVNYVWDKIEGHQSEYAHQYDSATRGMRKRLILDTLLSAKGLQNIYFVQVCSLKEVL
jgi:hypothetical protein